MTQASLDKGLARLGFFRHACQNSCTGEEKAALWPEGQKRTLKRRSTSSALCRNGHASGGR